MDYVQPRTPLERAQQLICQRDKRIAELEAEVARLMPDAERIDYIELIIRDGSYASILNDIIAFCQHGYKTFGPGPALRTAIDTYRSAAEGK